MSRFRPFVHALLLIVALAVFEACRNSGGGGTPAPNVAAVCGWASTNVDNLTPHFECVAVDDDDRRHAVFSVDNDGQRDVSAPLGPTNEMSPSPLGRGQPTSIAPGRRSALFAVDMPETSLTWTLGSQQATATASGRRCAVRHDEASVPSSGLSGHTFTLIPLQSFHLDQAVAASILPTESTNGVAAGTSNAAFDLGSDGSAQWSMPIATPPGRAGIEPHLSLQYSSGGGADGPLGVGFSLTGTSFISRCPAVHDDGAREGLVSFDNTDTFCLDGEPLVRALDGTYRKRHDDFSQVTIDGLDSDSALGPTSFTVRTKTGQILRYGTSGGSRLENLRIRLDGLPVSTGAGAAEHVVARYDRRARLSWALSEVRDRHDNVMRFSYRILSPQGTDCTTPNAACGAEGVEQLLHSIQYTSHESAPTMFGPHTVVMGYEVRPDARDRWLSEFHLAASRRLSSISSSSIGPSSLIVYRSYSLGYVLGAVTGRSTVSTIQECARDACKPTVRLGWTAGAFTRMAMPLGSERELDWPGKHPASWRLDETGVAIGSTDEQYDPSGEVIVLDADGDGLDDILYRSGFSHCRDPLGPLDPSGALPPPPPDCPNPRPPPTLTHSLNFYIRLGKDLGTGLGAGLAPAIISSQCVNNRSTGPLGQSYQNRQCVPAMPRAIDVDMDGRMELLLEQDLYRWNGMQYVLDPSFQPSNRNWDTALIGDLFGDNLPEIIPIGNALGFYINNDAGTLSSIVPIGPPGQAPFLPISFVTDLAGSGHHAIVAHHASDPDYSAYLFFGDSHAPQERRFPLHVPLSTGSPTGVSYSFADFNGDGLDDVVQIPNSPSGPGHDLLVGEGRDYVSLGAAANVSASDPVAGLTFPSPIDTRTGIVQDTQLRVLDENRDGRAELVSLTHGIPVSSDPSVPRATFAPTVFGTTDLPQYAPLALLDVNGDGIADILTQPDPTGPLVVYVSHTGEAAPDLLTHVAADEGDALDIHYGTTTQRADGAAIPAACGASHDAYCLARARVTVTDYIRSLGQETLEHSTVDWQDPIIGLAGRGFLGFATRIVHEFSRVDSTEVRTITTHYDNGQSNDDIAAVGGYAGIESAREELTRLADRTRLRAVTSEYVVVQDPTVPGAVRLHLRSSSDRTSETTPEGTAVLSSIQRTFDYDDFDNVTTYQTIAENARVRTTVVTTYKNDITRWNVGLPNDSTLTAVDFGAGVSETRETSYAFDDFGQLSTEITLPNASPDQRLATTYRYDAFGLVADVQETGASTTRLVESIEYDAAHHEVPVAISNGLGHRRQYFTHPSLDVPIAVLDANGALTTFQYDGFLRPRHAAFADGTSIDLSYVHQPGGLNTVTQTNALHQSLASTSDAVGRIITKRWIGLADADTVVDFQHNDPIRASLTTFTARPHFATDPSIGDSVAFDALGRPLSLTHADGAVASWIYSGLTTTSVDEVGARRIFVRDELARLIQSEQIPFFLTTGTNHPVAHAVVTTYQYFPLGEARTLTDPAGNQWNFSYDQRGRQTQSHSPDAGDRTLAYDAFGSLTSSTDSAGVKRFFHYDDLGRLLASVNADGIQCFAYDAAPNGLGHVASTKNEDGVSTSYAYDVMGHAVGSTVDVDGSSFTMSAKFDLGRLAALQYPDVDGSAPSVSIGFDNHGLAGSASFQGATIWTVDSRNAFGATTQSHFGNGATSTLFYDAERGFLRSIDTETPSTQLQGITIAYDPAGDVVGRQDLTAGYAEGFTYDGMHRLTDWASIDTRFKGAGNVEAHYSYDDLDNLITRDTTTPTATTQERFAVGGALGRPHQVVSSTSTAAYRYDDHGNQVYAGSGASTFQAGDRVVQYSVTNLPKTITTTAGDTTFKYDAMSSRVKKTSPDGSTILTTGFYEKRTRADGSVQHVFYLPGGVEAIWTRDANGVLQKELEYTFGDHEGSVTVVTDGSGNVLGRRRFEPFGTHVFNNAPASGAGPLGDDVRLGFTGDESDDDLALVNMNGRIYDPAIGRFLSADPVVTAPDRGQDLNPYSYVRNDPLNSTDPSGFDPCDELDVGCTFGTGFANFVNSVSSLFGGAGGSSGAGGSGNGVSHAPPAASPAPPPLLSASFWLPGLMGGDTILGRAGRDVVVHLRGPEGGTVTGPTIPYLSHTWVNNIVGGTESYGAVEEWFIVHGDEHAEDCLKVSLAAAAAAGALIAAPVILGAGAGAGTGVGVGVGVGEATGVTVVGKVAVDNAGELEAEGSAAIEELKQIAAGKTEAFGSYVYQLVDEAGDPVYYGISNDPIRRLGEHAAEANMPFSGMQVISGSQPLAQAQALESSLIDQAVDEDRIIYNVARRSISPLAPVEVPPRLIPLQTLLNPKLYPR